MDMQEMVNNAVAKQRAEEMKTSEQLTLGELILLFENIEKTNEVRFDFGYFCPGSLISWRGSYCELAIEYDERENDTTVEIFSAKLKSAIGKTFCGYKGGDFMMGKTTPVWAANYGDANCTAVVGVRQLDWGMVIIETKYIDY